MDKEILLFIPMSLYYISSLVDFIICVGILDSKNKTTVENVGILRNFFLEDYFLSPFVN